jgi:hypothetical protein
MNIEILISIIACLSALLAAIVSPYVARYFEKKRDVEQSVRNHKIEVYQKITGHWAAAILSTKTGKSEIDPQIISDLLSFIIREFVIWGSEDVICAYNEFLKVMRTNVENESIDITKGRLLVFERLLLVIRKDLGHTNLNLTEGSLLRLFVNDYDAFFKSKS